MSDVLKVVAVDVLTLDAHCDEWMVAAGVKVL